METKWKWFSGAVLILVLFSPDAEARTLATAAPGAAAHRGDQDIQQKRLAFIQHTIKLGLIVDIKDASPVTRVRVGLKFSSLSFREKEDILNIVWAYYKTVDPQKNVVVVIEKKSGRKIGEYSPANGGLRVVAVSK